MNPSDIDKAYDEIAHVWASDDFTPEGVDVSATMITLSRQCHTLTSL